MRENSTKYRADGADHLPDPLLAVAANIKKIALNGAFFSTLLA